MTDSCPHEMDIECIGCCGEGSQKMLRYGFVV